MPVKHDYYELLGVPKTASAQEIEQAYRKMAVQHHPDRVPPEKKDEAREKFKEISEAYAVLSDQQKRRQYDQFGHAGIDSKYSSEDIFRGADFSSIFEDLGIGGEGAFNMGDVFSEIFGGGGRTRGGRRPRRGADIEYPLSITLEEAYGGTEKQIQYYHTEPCAVCKGTGVRPGSAKKVCGQCRGTGQHTSSIGGFMTFARPCPSCGGAGEVIDNPCKECGGRGKIKRKVQLTVKIPPGVDSGTGIRVREKGEAGEFGGPPGDLYVVTHIQPNEGFTREGMDLFTQKTVTFPAATLGGDIEIQTLSGKVDMKIPPGTQSNKTFRVKNKGMPDLHNPRNYGDLYVQVIIHVPTKLSDRQKELLREFSKTLE